MKQKREWSGKSRGGKTGYKIFVFLLRHFGLKPAYFLLYFVAFYFFITSWKTNKYIFNYFRKYNYSWFKRLSRTYRNYYIFGQIIIDKVASMAGFKAKFTFSFEGEEYLNQMTSEESGGIMMSAHIGNWEIAGHYFDRLEKPVNVVMLDAEYAQIKDYLNSLGSRQKANIIPIKDDLSHLLLILEALNRKEIVCLHADRVLQKSPRNLKLKFLGKEAEFPYSIFKLIVSLQVPVSFVFAFKETSSHYHFFATPAKLYTDADREVAITKLSGDYVNEIEKKIKSYPIQWFNYYDFWQEQA